MDSNFDQASAPLDLPAQDPDIATGTSVSSIATVDLGNGVLERTINLTAVSGTITLKDVPLAGIQPREACKGLANPTLESLVEMEGLLLSQPDRPGHARRIFDRLWTTWCIRANKTETAWAYQTEMR